MTKVLPLSKNPQDGFSLHALWTEAELLAACIQSAMTHVVEQNDSIDIDSDIGERVVAEFVGTDRLDLKYIAQIVRTADNILCRPVRKPVKARGWFYSMFWQQTWAMSLYADQDAYTPDFEAFGYSHYWWNQTRETLQERSIGTGVGRDIASIREAIELGIDPNMYLSSGLYSEKTVADWVDHVKSNWGPRMFLPRRFYIDDLDQNTEEVEIERFESPDMTYMPEWSSFPEVVQSVRDLESIKADQPQMFV